MKLQIDVNVRNYDDIYNALEQLEEDLMRNSTNGTIIRDGEEVGRFELLQPQEPPTPLSDAEAAALPPIR
jgi:hypothetical protein